MAGTDADDVSRWTRLFDVASTQANMVTGRQAVALGFNRSTLHDRAVREGWPRPFRGVYLLPGTPLSEEVRAIAAALSVGEGCVITGRTALAVHRISDRWPHPIELAIDEAANRKAPHGTWLRRTTTLRDDDTMPYGGVLLANTSRAFLDAAPRLTREQLRNRLIDGRQRRLLTVDDVALRALDEPSAKGRQRLLAACDDVAGSGADSVFVREVETWLWQLGIAFDVPPRTVRTPTRILNPDVTLTDLPVAIEADGFGAHATRRTLERDQRKHNAYLLAGWIVLRIGWHRFVNDRDGFLAELRAAIEQARSHTHVQQ